MTSDDEQLIRSMEEPVVNVALQWRGPVAVKDVPTEPGVYMVLGDHHVHGDRALLYIGKSSDLGTRTAGHARSWLADEWRSEIYCAKVEPHILDDVERLLIYAHSPAYNGSSTDSVTLKSSIMRIWNVGTFPRLLPEITSSHPWLASGCRRR